MSSDRVLNFSEFADKYSKDKEQDVAASFSDIQKAADNFQEGFDETSYDDGSEIKPNRPINQGEESTPDKPGEEKPTETEGMEAPVEGEEEEGLEIPEEGEENEGEEGSEEIEDEDLIDGEPAETSEEPEDMDDIEEGGNPEDEDDDDEDKDDENEEEKEEEEANESKNNKFTRSEKILESFNDFTDHQETKSGPYKDVLDKIELEYDDDEDTTLHDKCVVMCKSCGAVKEIKPGEDHVGNDKVEDPTSWWRGTSLGMQCDECYAR